MKVVFSPKDVSSALSKLSKFTGKADILKSVWCWTEGKVLYAQATNMVSCLTVKIPLHHSEPGEFVTPLSEFRSILTKVTDSLVALTLKEDRIHLVTPSRSRYKLPVYPVGDFPKTEIPDPEECHVLPTGTFLQALESARAVCGSEVYTPGLRQVLIEPDRILSGDGIAYREVKFTNNSLVTATIPTTELPSILAVLKGFDGEEISVGSQGTISLEAGGNWVSIKPVTDQFPDLDKVFTNTKISCPDKLRINVVDLVKVLTKVSPTDESVVEFDLTKETLNEVKVVTTSGEFESESYLPVVWEGMDLKLRFDIGKLKSVVRTMTSEEVVIMCGEAQAPVLIEDPQHTTILNQVV